MNAELEKLDPQESLALIREMILQAKGNVQKNAFYFLLWGWVVVIANLGMFVLDQVGFQYPFAIWAITIPAWIFTIVKSYSNRAQRGVVTHFDRINLSLWLCFGAVTITIIAFGFQINYHINPLLLLVAALPTFVSGVILKFTPLLTGGVLFWISGIISFLVPISYQPLVGALAITTGYLIPGYMLKNKKE